MDYTRLIQKFKLPSGFKPPKELAYEDIKAKPLTRQDLKVDIEGVNASLEIIRKTRGGSWPEKAVTEEFDLLDLAWHERELREGDSFAYVVYDNHDTYVGCFYLYPMGLRTELSRRLLQHDVDASWWVTAAAYKKGYYEKLYEALKRWVHDEFLFENIYYSNEEMPEKT